ncbi:MAG: hypothetical protein AB1673_12840 [Actinomycetota bacterium]
MTTAPSVPDEAPAPVAGDGAVDAPADRGRWLTAVRRRQLATGSALLGLFTLLSLVMAFPEVDKWRTATPGDYGDQFLIQWLMQWDVHSLLSRSDPLFHPNIFWPNRNVLFYSDTLLAIAPVTAAVAWLTDWTIAYNVVYLSGWVISLASAYALARWVGASRAAAVLAGIAFSFAAVRLGHYSHFQLQFAYFVPLTVWLLLRFFEEKRWWQAGAVGICCAAAFLNAAYIALVLYPTVAVIVVGWLLAERGRLGAKVWAGLALAGVVTLVLTVPFLREYRAMGVFLSRAYPPEATVTPKNFLSPAHGSWLYGWMQDLTGSPFENRLFSGFAAMGLGAVGGVAVWKGRTWRWRTAPVTAAGAPGGTGPGSGGDDAGWAGEGVEAGSDGEVASPAQPPPSAMGVAAGAAGVAAGPAGPAGATAGPAPARTGPTGPDLRRRGLLLFLLASLVPLVLSFGKYQFVFGKPVPLPYRLIGGLPGFESVRAFGRFIVVPLMALGLLAALGYDRLVSKRGARARLVTAVVLGCVMLAEYRVSLHMAPRVDRPEVMAVNQALARLPDGPVVELPMADNHEWTWAYIESPRMVLSTIDWKPRVNGYSGYSPPGYEKSVRLFNSLGNGRPASAEALAYMDQLRIRYLVVRMAPLDRDQSMLGRSFVDEEGAARYVAALPPERIESVSREGAALLIRLRPPP